MAEHGVVFGEPQTDINKVRIWKDKVVDQLTGGLGGMAKMRNVTVVNGFGKFTGPNSIEVVGEETTTINFDNAIIAAVLAQSNFRSFHMKTHVFGILRMH